MECWKYLLTKNAAYFAKLAGDASFVPDAVPEFPEFETEDYSKFFDGIGRFVNESGQVSKFLRKEGELVLFSFLEPVLDPKGNHVFGYPMLYVDFVFEERRNVWERLVSRMSHLFYDNVDRFHNLATNLSTSATYEDFKANVVSDAFVRELLSNAPPGVLDDIAFCEASGLFGAVRKVWSYAFFRRRTKLVPVSVFDLSDMREAGGPLLPADVIAATRGVRKFNRFYRTAGLTSPLDAAKRLPAVPHPFSKAVPDAERAFVERKW